MKQNLISATLSAQDTAAIKGALALIKEKMPFLRDLTPTERESLAKLGPKSLSFVQGCHRVSKQHPGILPRSLDLEEFNRDVQLFADLVEFRDQVEALHTLIDNSCMAAGSDAMRASLRVYRAAKAEGEGEGLEPLLDELGERFARQVRKDDEDAKSDK